MDIKPAPIAAAELIPRILKLRDESHLMLIGSTRSGKTTVLAELIPSDADVVYMSLKRDSIPVYPCLFLSLGRVTTSTLATFHGMLTLS